MKALFNWSSGKDSTLALHYLLEQKTFKEIELFTSINKHFNRVSMHGIRTELVEKQAKSLGLNLNKLELPEMPSMEDYNQLMKEKLEHFTSNGFEYSIFGDIFLEDLRKYREEKLAEVGLKGVFPLWKKDTKELIQEFISLGYKTIVVCVNDSFLDKSFVGRIIDEQFIKDLPSNVDPCGENGEFHTFTFDGPIFKNPVDFEIGEIVYKTYPKPKTDDSEYNCSENIVDNGFYFCDLV